MAVVVDDPSKGIQEGNLVGLQGDGTPCKHLVGDEPGKYHCKIHHYDWYQDTPCFRHIQVGRKNEPCRIGQNFLKKKG